MSHAAGRVWVGPGVEKSTVDDTDGVTAAEVTAIVGAGVPGVTAGCVHPAARTSITQSSSAERITGIFFIADHYLLWVFDGCVLRMVSGGIFVLEG